MSIGDDYSGDINFEGDEFQGDFLALYLNQIGKTSIRGPDEIEALCKQLEQAEADFFASVVNDGGHKSRTFLRDIKPRRKDLSKSFSSPQQAAGYSGKVRDKNLKFRELRDELLIRTAIDCYYEKHKAAPSLGYLYKKMRSGSETKDDQSRRLILVPKFLAKFNKVFQNEISYQNQWCYWRAYMLRQFSMIELSPLPRQKMALIDAIKAELVKSHLLFVVWVVRRYYRKIEDVSLFQDIIQEGNIGLMRAVDHYDYRKGYRFSTYALWWIRNSINKAMQFQMDVLCRAKGFFEKKNQLSRSYMFLTQKLGREPTLEEVAKNIGWTEEETSLVIKSFQDTLSFDNPIQVEGDDESYDSPFGEFLFDRLSASSEDVLLEKELETLTSKAVNTLDAKLGEIIRLRFGLGGGEEHTLEEIGQKFRVSRERIRQLEERAFRQLTPLLERFKNEI